MKSVLIPFVSFIICLTIVWRWTNGFKSFTSYSYTLEEAGQVPRLFPDIQLMDLMGHQFTIKEKHNFVLVNFASFNFHDSDSMVIKRTRSLYKLFDSATIPSLLEFVTINIATNIGDSVKMREYLHNFDQDTIGWTLAMPYQINDNNFNRFLRRVGVWAHKMPPGKIINHSNYLFLVAPNHNIVKIFDPKRNNDYSIKIQIRRSILENEISPPY